MTLDQPTWCICRYEYTSRGRLDPRCNHNEIEQFMDMLEEQHDKA